MWNGVGKYKSKILTYLFYPIETGGILEMLKGVQNLQELSAACVRSDLPARPRVHDDSPSTCFIQLEQVGLLNHKSAIFFNTYFTCIGKLLSILIITYSPSPLFKPP